MVNEVVYLGQKINSQGIQPVQEKVKAITNAPAPTNVSEVRSYLGMINYYQKYLPILSTILAPLHSLLEKGKSWKWSEEHQEAFRKSKELLKSSYLLVHYDPEKELIYWLVMPDHMAWGLFCHTGWKTTQNNQLHLPRDHCPQLEKNILN
jgi:hypothetical protein